MLYNVSFKTEYLILALVGIFFAYFPVFQKLFQRFCTLQNATQYIFE